MHPSKDNAKLSSLSDDSENDSLSQLLSEVVFLRMRLETTFLGHFFCPTAINLSFSGMSVVIAVDTFLLFLFVRTIVILGRVSGLCDVEGSW